MNSQFEPNQFQDYRKSLRKCIQHSKNRENCKIDDTQVKRSLGKVRIKKIQKSISKIKIKDTKMNIRSKEVAKVNKREGNAKIDEQKLREKMSNNQVQFFQSSLAQVSKSNKIREDLKTLKEMEFQFFSLSDIIRMMLYKNIYSNRVYELIVDKTIKHTEQQGTLKKNLQIESIAHYHSQRIHQSKNYPYLLKIAQTVYNKFYQSYEDHPDKAKTLWFQNQLKIFFWIIICISLFQNKKIKDFETSEWLQIKKIFTEKDIYTFEYEAKRILASGRKSSRAWNSEENNLLKKVMSDQTLKNKWNEVARIFYAQSAHKYFRTGKQCREHWLNHLDPSKKHGKWTDQEDQQIIKYVFQNGKKWSSIIKDLMSHRTEHMIKNRYKALLFQEKKKMSTKHYDEKKILKKIVKRITEIRADPEDQNIIQDVRNEEEMKFKAEIGNGRQNEKKQVPITPVDEPLNNFNYGTNYPWVYIWGLSVPMMGSYNIISAYNEFCIGEYEKNYLGVNIKQEFNQGSRVMKRNDDKGQETFGNVSTQMREQ